MTNGEGFSPDEAIFLQEYSAYCKEKWCPADGKDPLFGRVDGFQIDPKRSPFDKICDKLVWGMS